MITVKIH